MNICKLRNLNLSVSSESFKESLSEATCVMYYAMQVKKGWDGPHRNFAYPQYWTNDHEEIWIDYLRNRIFNQDMWERFWATIIIDPCISAIPDWVENMQIIMPQYVLRDIGVLIHSGMILEPTKNRVVENQEITYEEDEYYDSS